MLTSLALVGAVGAAGWWNVTRGHERILFRPKRPTYRFDPQLGFASFGPNQEYWLWHYHIAPASTPASTPPPPRCSETSSSSSPSPSPLSAPNNVSVTSTSRKTRESSRKMNDEKLENASHPPFLHSPFLTSVHVSPERDHVSAKRDCVAPIHTSPKHDRTRSSNFTATSGVGSVRASDPHITNGIAPLSECATSTCVSATGCAGDGAESEVKPENAVDNVAGTKDPSVETNVIWLAEYVTPKVEPENTNQSCPLSLSTMGLNGVEESASRCKMSESTVVLSEEAKDNTDIHVRKDTSKDTINGIVHRKSKIDGRNRRLLLIGTTVKSTTTTSVPTTIYATTTTSDTSVTAPAISTTACAATMSVTAATMLATAATMSVTAATMSVTAATMLATAATMSVVTKPAKLLVFFLHGTGGNIGSARLQLLDLVDSLQRRNMRLDLVVAAPEYPGYGHATFDDIQPTERTAKLAVWNTLRRITSRYPSHKLVLVGYSIGVGFATWLARACEPPPPPPPSPIAHSPPSHSPVMYPPPLHSPVVRSSPSPPPSPSPHSVARASPISSTLPYQAYSPCPSIVSSTSYSPFPSHAPPKGVTTSFASRASPGGGRASSPFSTSPIHLSIDPRILQEMPPFLPETPPFLPETPPFLPETPPFLPETPPIALLSLVSPEDTKSTLSDREYETSTDASITVNTSYRGTGLVLAPFSVSTSSSRSGYEESKLIVRLDVDEHVDIVQMQCVNVVHVATHTQRVAACVERLHLHSSPRKSVPVGEPSLSLPAKTFVHGVVTTAKSLALNLNVRPAWRPRIAGLMLVSGFSSAESLLGDYGAGLLMPSHVFDNKENVRKLSPHVPLYIVHGARDDLIHCNHSHVLYNASRSTNKRRILQKRSDHYNVRFIHHIRRFLRFFI